MRCEYHEYLMILYDLDGDTQCKDQAIRYVDCVPSLTNKTGKPGKLALCNGHFVWLMHSKQYILNEAESV